MNTATDPSVIAPSAAPEASEAAAGTPCCGADPRTAAAPPAARRVSLALDPVTHEELQRAAGHRDVASYLYVLAGRYARWNELREWLSQLETAYGPLPPEALERIHRRMLGLPRRRDGVRSVSVTFSDAEFAALSAAAGDRPVAAHLRELLADQLCPARGGDGSDDSARGEVEHTG
ncbi:hypothetical protein [Streptomonospora litoralis]|uniref:Uncharacterized protein n=1 Tax=Streptomonospora litoralis TaxID=2498135 RepID=A0A4P6Q3Z5_9ACTN|nr:hypothetical protein [Streptomonospora litoralis]QBI55418.1 hypothetical protein EKD16_18270 [Streptomonospora litoralis]